MNNPSISTVKGINPSLGDIFYDSSGICHIFTGNEWRALYAKVSKNAERISAIDSIFANNNIRKKN